jgi:septal ring factor EnvC (AmiA/AmiB activator)
MIRNKTFQLKLSHLIIGGILLLLLVFLVKCDVEKPTPTDKYEKQKQEIERLKNNIFLLKEGQKILTKNIEQQNHIVDSLNIEIKHTEKELQTTRTYYGNKIKDLTSASNTELEQFFSDRYR